MLIPKGERSEYHKDYLIQRPEALRILDVLGIPYRDDIDEGPAWNGKILHSHRILPCHIAHEAGHWLVAGDLREFVNYGLGVDIDYGNEVETQLPPGEDGNEYEMLASYLGVLIGMRAGMSRRSLCEGVGIEVTAQTNECQKYFARLNRKGLLPGQDLLKSTLDKAYPVTGPLFKEAFMNLAFGGVPDLNKVETF